MRPGEVFKRVGWAAALIAVIGVVLMLVAVSSAKVELSANGAHTRVLVPVVVGAIGFPIYSGTGEDVLMPGHLDGPIVRRGANANWSATWFCEDRVRHASGTGARLRIDCAGSQHAFALASAPVPAAVAPMPDRLVVLSDLEGNIGFLDAALRRLEVVGADGDWRFGRGHLVVLGDAVDRGRDAFAVLWRLHELARQAHAAGGAVHLVLGNHEQYILRGNTSRAHPEHRYALRAMGGVADAFAADSVIGGWLRAQPVVLKLGRVLFAHGGISPAVAGTGLSVDKLNAAMHAYWRTPAGTAERSPAFDAVLGDAGVTQYRGYFRASDRYPAATTTGVERVLKHFGAEQIVVAHTLVERIERLHGGRVIAVDVNHDEARPEVLVYTDGEPAIVDIGIRRGLDTQAPPHLRGFSLLSPADRQLVGSMLQAYGRLSGVPQPY